MCAPANPRLSQENYTYQVGQSEGLFFFFVYFTIDLSRAMFTTRDGFGMPARLNPHMRVNPLNVVQCNTYPCAVSALSETACLDQSAFIYLTTPSTHRKFVVSCEIK